MNPLHPISPTPAYFLLAVVACLIVFDCRRDVRQLVSARNVFLITIIAWYVLEAAMVPAKVVSYGQSSYNLALISVFTCVFSFLISYYVLKGGIFDPIFKRLASIDNPSVIWKVFLIVVFIGFLPALYVSKGNVLLILEDAFSAKKRWSGLIQRGRFGGAYDAFTELQMFLRAAIPLAAAIVVQPRQATERRVFATAFLVYMLAAAFNGGTRSKVVEVFLPVAAGIYWRLPAKLKRQAIVFGLPLIAVAGLYWSAASVLGRNSGKLDWENASEANYVGFEMFRELQFIQNMVPEKADYKYGHTYLVQIVNPIPRAIWPNKPIGDAGLELAVAQGHVASSGEAYMTLSPGLIGEMYWNFSLPGIVLLSSLLGYLARSWDRVRSLATQSILAFTVFAAGLGIVFLSGRSISMPVLYGMVALFAILIFFAKPVSPRRVAGRPNEPPRSHPETRTLNQ